MIAKHHEKVERFLVLNLNIVFPDDPETSLGASIAKG